MVVGSFTRFFLILALAVGFAFSFGNTAYADEAEYKTYNTPRFTLYFGTKKKADGADAVDFDNLLNSSIEILEQTFTELSELLDEQPERKVIVRFLTPDQFQKLTNAPSWTNAMFFRGEIAIPINEAQPMSKDELARAIRHEYVHAVFAELSGFKCPAWLDEGVAQIFEGKPNPLLGPGLRNWIADNDAMPMEWLENGFTGLHPSIVPAAYAQSLFIAKVLVEEHGYKGIRSYLTLLRERISDGEAFKVAFKMSKEEFHASLTGAIKVWAISGEKHP